MANRSVTRWTAAGAVFGGVFPVVAGVIRVVEFGWPGARAAFATDPLLWIIASAPVFLGLFASAAGHQSDKVRDLNRMLEDRVRERTEELRQRNAEMRLVFDTVDQGLLTVDLEGRIGSERSRAAAEWLGLEDDSPKATLAEVLETLDARVGQALDMGLDQLRTAILPADVALDQLPRSLAVGNKYLELTYHPTRAEETAPQAVLVVVSDATARVQRERAEERQKELFGLLERSKRDQEGVISFLRDADEQIEQVSSWSPDDRDARFGALRSLHTLKGNAGLMGLRSIARTCHALEDEIAEASVDKRSLMRLGQEWKSFRSQIGEFIDVATAGSIEVERRSYDALLKMVHEKYPGSELEDSLRGWSYEPGRVALGRLAEQVRALATQLGKGDVDIALEDNGVRLQPRAWTHFWGSLVHVVRNAVDHGLDSRIEREQQGKPPTPTITLSMAQTDTCVEVVIADDGRGIDWDALRARCRDRGLPCSSDEDLVEALFVDGVSTRGEATAFSGRGVGMAAVREATRALGGKVLVDSEPGRGTRWTFIVPDEEGRSATSSGSGSQVTADGADSLASRSAEGHTASAA